MPTAVISDLHGDVSLLRGILELIGATDRAGIKQSGWTLLQVGDAVNRSYLPYTFRVPPEATREQRSMITLAEQARDFATLEECEALLDGIALGNHEGADFGFMCHGDYDRAVSPVQDRVRSLLQRDFIRAAFHVGDWLVTHSGVHPRWWDDAEDGVPVRGRSAAQVAESLNDLLCESLLKQARSGQAPMSPFWGPGVLSAVSEKRWGGPFRLMFKQGGILWGAWSELCEGYATEFSGEPAPHALKQIVGHTPQTKPAKDGTYPLVDIDVGAKFQGAVCAAVTHDDGKTWETHVFRNPLKV